MIGMWCSQCYAWVERYHASKDGTHFWPCGHRNVRLVFEKPIVWKAP